MNSPVGEMPLKSVLARWDALVLRWDLDEPERHALLGGVPTSSVSDVEGYDAATAEQRMRLVLELDETLKRVFGNGIRSNVWLRSRNRRLGGSTPLDVMSTSTAWMR